MSNLPSQKKPTVFLNMKGSCLPQKIFLGPGGEVIPSNEVSLIQTSPELRINKSNIVGSRMGDPIGYYLFESGVRIGGTENDWK
jgi:hypothetical protein